MNDLSDFKNIGPFYNNPKRAVLIILVFVMLLASIILIDLRYNPYPPMVSFIDGSRYIQGRLYLDDNFLGYMKDMYFGNLPDSYCKGNHTLTLETENQVFSWSTDSGHCTTNLVKFEVRTRDR